MAPRHSKLKTDARIIAAVQAQPGRTAEQIGQAICGRAIRYTQPLARLVARQRLRAERRVLPSGFVTLTYWPVP